MPVAYAGAHERQKGARDRHENDLLCRVHPPGDLCYHMVLLLQVERENRRGKYFPFQHLYVLSPRRRSLVSLTRSCDVVHVSTYIYMYIYMRVCVCSKRYFAHVLFSLCTRRHEKGLMPYSCQSLARDSTRQFPFISTGFFRVYIVYFAVADVFYRNDILFSNKVGCFIHMRFHCGISWNIGTNIQASILYYWCYLRNIWN